MRYKNLGPLHDLLLEACPPVDGRKSIVILAEKLGISHQYIYRWIENGRVPQKFVRPIGELGTINVERLYPYVFC